MPDPLNGLIQAIGHESQRQHKQGNHGKSQGLSLIAVGIFTLPVPIIGIPLIIMGIWKLCS